MNTPNIINNENGSIMVLALLLLVILTLIGLGGTTTTSTDCRIAANEKTYTLAFFASEAAMSYVAATPSLYGTSNVTVGSSLSITPQTLNTSPPQSFDGTVAYLGDATPPRGSGYEAGGFRAHRYNITCTGYGPLNAVSNLEAGFYRIGF